MDPHCAVTVVYMLKMVTMELISRLKGIYLDFAKISTVGWGTTTSYVNGSTI